MTTSEEHLPAAAGTSEALSAAEQPQALHPPRRADWISYAVTVGQQEPPIRTGSSETSTF